jgi:hypothetical protein
MAWIIRLAFFAVVLRDALGKLDYSSLTGPCTEFNSLGNAVFCWSPAGADGKCIDGTSMNSPGQCQGLYNVCIDVTPAPSSCP